MKAVIYARISSDQQSEYSLAAQVEECRSYIEKEKYDLANVYIDDGYSAKNTNRPQLQQMMDDLKRKKFNIIVIWRLDRLTRDTMDGLNMVKNLFKPNGVEFASVTEDIDTSTPDGYMMFTIRLSIAQNEREKIAERVRLGIRERAKNGLRQSVTTPYGYDIGENLSLVMNRSEAENVKRAFDLYLSGQGFHRIAKTFNDEAIPTKLGAPHWKSTVVRTMIMNPVYTGVVRLRMSETNEEIIVPNMHEAIITKEVFEASQKIVRRKSEGKMTASSYDFPFTLIVKCGECGRNYYGQQKHNQSGTLSRYYRCRGNAHTRNCSQSNISEPKLTKLFLDFLRKFEFETTDETRTVGSKDIEKEIKRLKKLIDDSSTKKKNYTRAMGSGKLDYSLFEELIDEENQKINSWQTELIQYDNISPSSNRTRKDIISGINRLTNDWDVLTYLERKSVVQNLFEALVIKKTSGTWEIVGYKLAD